MADKKTFFWKNISDWGPLVSQVIPESKRNLLLQEFEDSPELFKYEDDVSSFKKVYSNVGCYNDLKNFLLTHLYNNFSYVRMFHLARPMDVQTYYEKGFLPLDCDNVNQDFREKFLNNPSFPDIVKSQLDAAISSMDNSSQRNGYTYFGLDDRFLIEHCGQYLIYGSEYFLSLASRLGSKIQDTLSSIGIPTVFCVDVPIELISDSDLTELGESALHTWAYGLVHSDKKVREIDFTISITEKLPPKQIVAHYHPNKIRDPQKGNRIYTYDEALQSNS